MITFLLVWVMDSAVGAIQRPKGECTGITSIGCVWGTQVVTSILWGRSYMKTFKKGCQVQPVLSKGSISTGTNSTGVNKDYSVSDCTTSTSAHLSSLKKAWRLQHASERRIVDWQGGVAHNVSWVVVKVDLAFVSALKLLRAIFTVDKLKLLVKTDLYLAQDLELAFLK